VSERQVGEQLVVEKKLVTTDERGSGNGGVDGAVQDGDDLVASKSAARLYNTGEIFWEHFD
jgi:hypothetical protein